ncbi:cupredoxin domain-containing protein [Saliphagus infecundisoli]|uniref:Plastocyanin/azurin family copper-binding protein n=1 Tax=Saliphagus infecundisoli TaxID=1849069 RepID=A0ABD5QHS0_9EURY|nr:plastocyanin/azurin family copper-binding protein [Saliphagus infecundisoli]
MKDEAFDPVQKTVAPGTTVVWKNTGLADHLVDSVQFHDAADQWQFRTQTLRSGDSAVYAFDQEGVYEYYCGLQGEEMCRVILVGDVSLSSAMSHSLIHFHVNDGENDRQQTGPVKNLP